MRFELTHDPPSIRIDNITDMDAQVLIGGFGLANEGDSVMLVRGDILGPKDDEGVRPILAFELRGRPNLLQPRTIILQETEAPPKKKPSGKKKKGG